ncbi:hypothetical protein DAY19_01680 [Halobacteriovorax vibrionivorans]|uniref:YggT family protein n=1 Tax=Halobacteriovorax vibrionivorans TaxID=2152716 RepID=A0ABY0IHT5_9BACT|nr:hypothetical protein DAY19_01680 [Halobacteriovorax vibrionivorans]TGD47698.1 hypothetical protein EP118_07045 [Halobacteriovorax sp. Y22]
MLIRTLIDIYIFILIIDVIISYIPQYKSHPVAIRIKQISDYTCGPVRRMLPEMDIPFDISPMIVILVLKIFVAIF